MASGNHDRFHCCFKDWITQQHEDLKILNTGLTLNSTDTNHLRGLTQTIIKHFEDYAVARSELAPIDAPSFLCPSWCTSFENSCLWIGGCRPSLSFRIIYSLCGSEIEAQLTRFLQGERKGNLGEITGKQLELIDHLHCKTVKGEDKLSSKMASLQENIADHPLVIMANNAGRVGETSVAVDQAIDDHSKALAGMMVEADKLRLNTLKELAEILSPLQSVELLVVSKKLHLSMREWGKHRDHNIGKRNNHI